MLRYPQVENTVSAPNDIHIGKELLGTVNSRECILVAGPHLAMQSHVEEGRGDSGTSFYLRRLLRGMVEWCVQQGIVDRPTTIEKLRQLPYSESLAHAGNKLEEYLIEQQQLQRCLAEVLRNTSQLTQAHQELAHLPFRGYISTTYDTFIEITYEQVHQRKLPKFYTSSIAAAVKACQDEKPFILKLYGDIDNPASIIFGQRLNKGLSSTGNQDALCELLSMSTVVFLGFEETDPDLMYLTDLLPKSQSLNLLAFPQPQTLTNWYVWEDSANKINVHTFHPSLTNIAVLPETHTIPTASTGSHTQKPRTSISSPLAREMLSPPRANQAPPIEIYTVYAYTQNDKTFFRKIKEQLAILQRQRKHISCIEDEVTLSNAWERNGHLATANLILLLVSSTFLNSDFCYCDQMHTVVERHKADSNRCCVIPVLLRPLPRPLLRETPFGWLDFLPSTGKAISEYRDKDQAYNNITEYLVSKIKHMTFYV